MIFVPQSVKITHSREDFFAQRRRGAEKTRPGVSSWSFSAPLRLCARRSPGTVLVAVGRAVLFVVTCKISPGKSKS
jgi:hypothetical protein